MQGGVCLTTDLENLVVGDMLLKNGDRVVHTDLGDQVRQELVVRFSFFKGEWWLNLEAGTPWMAVIGEKGAEDDLRFLCTQVVTTCPGVASLETLTLEETRPRHFAVNFVAKLTNGAELTFAAFVLAPPTQR